MATNTPSTRSDFYVYALFRETGVPFYIGKGRGYRWTYHESEALRSNKSHKCRIIRDMRARGFEVIKTKLHDGLTETVAHEYEVALIATVGRHPLGPLTNGTDGGEGLAGYIPTPEHIAKAAAARRGQKRTIEARARMSASALASEARIESNARTAKLLRGRKHSPEALANMSASQLGKKQSAEHIAKRMVAHIGKKRSAETRANITASLTGRMLSPEHRKNVGISQRGKKQTPAAIAKTVAAHLGSKRSPETCANISAAKTGKPWSEVRRGAWLRKRASK